MAENTAPEATIDPPASTSEKKPESKKSGIDPTKPLSSQINKLSELMGDTSEKEEPKKVDEPAKPEEKPETSKEEEPPAPSPTEPPAPDEDEEVREPVDLGPAEKYVVDRLPNIQARIVDGGVNKTVFVKADGQLPPGFKFQDDSALTQFTRDLTAQELRADKLFQQYNAQKQQEAVKEYETVEAQDVASDLARLQKQGVIPEFKYDENDPKFNTDPSVKEANEIYDIFKKTNDAYARKFLGTSRTYRISYEDATYRYYANKNRTKSETPKEEPKEPKVNNAEREEVAKKIGAPASAEPAATRPKAQPGMSMNDINRLFKMGRI